MSDSHVHTELVTAPEVEALSVATVKEHLSIIGTDHDVLIRQILIPFARDFVEDETGLRLIEQTVQTKLRCFPRGRRIELPIGPHDATGTTQVFYTLSGAAEVEFLAANQWNIEPVDEFGRGGAIILKEGVQWPTGTMEPGLAVRISYRVGFALKQSNLTADTDTNQNVLNTTAPHGLTVTDLIRNQDRENATARVLTDINASSIRTETIPEQASGDTITPWTTSNIPSALNRAMMMLCHDAYITRGDDIHKPGITRTSRQAVNAIIRAYARESEQ